MNHPRRFRFSLCLLPLLSLTVLSAGADAGMITIDGTNSGFKDGVERVIGWEFTVGNSAILLTELGVFDFNTDGLVDSHQVGVWTTDKSLVVSGTVSAGTSAPLEGFFRYVDVADVTLAANTRYIIGTTWDANGDELVWDVAIGGAPGFEVTGFSVNPLISLPPPGSGTGRFNDTSSAFAFPEKTLGSEFGDPRNALWGPNFKAQAVPEPSSLALLGIGCLALLGVSRRRRSIPHFTP
jgi:PEP-CTERM motif